MKKGFIFLLSALLVAGCSQPSPSPVEQVDPMIGSGGHGHVFVGANYPHGMVQLGPVQPNKGWDWCSGYHNSGNQIVGFSHSRLTGTGIGDLSDVLFMPYDPARVKLDTTGRIYADLKHENESIRPGYYSIDMQDYGIKAELTATPRVGYHRYYADSEKLAILVDLTNGVGWDAISDACLSHDGDRMISGYRRSTGWAKDQIYYFAAEFSQPFSLRNPIDSCGAGVQRVLEFDLADNRCLEVKVALSPVSETNARMNLETELPGWDFDRTAENAEIAWNSELSRIEIEPMDERQGRIFYTALYHTMIVPSLFSDVDNSYRGADGKVHQSDGPVYTILSLWDTYRAAMPLTTLIDSEKSSRMVNTFMNIYREQGKLPVWHLAGNETDCMVGNPGVVVLGDLLLKGFVPEELKAEAVEAMRVSSMLDERNMDLLKEYGYIPFDKTSELETLAKCMEYAIADALVAKSAAAIGDKETEEYFSNRSRSYKYYFDPETKFMRGRAADGSFRTPFDPFIAPHMQSDYTEGNAWQYTWLVPHDVHGLVGLFDSEEEFLNKLSELFVIEGDLGSDANDVTGLIGTYAHGNEPSHHVAYMFNYVGAQHRCAELVRQILETMYTDQIDGLSGNEDAGQMSAWYVLSALGLYQADPSEGIFLFGSPAVKSAKINLDGGRSFEITAHDNSAENIYIDHVKLNGKDYTRSYITYEDIMNGGTLEFWMSPTPSSFGSDLADRP